MSATGWLLLGAACFLIGAGVCVLVLAALRAGGKADEEIERQQRERDAA